MLMVLDMDPTVLLWLAIQILYHDAEMLFRRIPKYWIWSAIRKPLVDTIPHPSPYGKRRRAIGAPHHLAVMMEATTKRAGMGSSRRTGFFRPPLCYDEK